MPHDTASQACHYLPHLVLQTSLQQVAGATCGPFMLTFHQCMRPQSSPDAVVVKTGHQGMADDGACMEQGRATQENTG